MAQTVASPGDLIAVAAIIFAFGIAVFIFRIQREVAAREAAALRRNGVGAPAEREPDQGKHEVNSWPTWLPCADWLIIASVVMASCAVIPLTISPSVRNEVLASAACVAAIILQVGYIPAIMAHYRIVIGTGRRGLRKSGEPAERWIVAAFILVAASAFVLVLFRHLCQ